jgi:hypothetical protein
MTMFDEPQALHETLGFITAAWNAAPVAAKVIERTAPILGVKRHVTNEEKTQNSWFLMDAMRIGK